MVANEMPEANYFIGLIDEEGEGEFTWIDGTEFDASEFGQVFENDLEVPAVVILNDEGEWEVVAIDDIEANFVFENTCIQMGVDIDQNDEDDDEEMIQPGTTAAVSYVAQDACETNAECGFEVVFVAEAVAYCEPTGIATDEENPYFLESFSLNGYTVESGDDQGYGNYTDQHFLFEPGEVVNMESAFAGPNIDEVPMYSRIWMDLNNDGDFFDEGELVLQSVDVEGGSNELEIPNVGAAVEGTIMRIAVSRLTFAESCGDFLNGEVEDYTITINKPQQSQGQTDSSIANNGLGADLFAYPNPAKNELFVEMKNMEVETTTLRIFNSVGQLMSTEQVLTNSIVRVDLSEYNDGLYSVITESDRGVRLVQKFIVKK